MLFMSQMMKKEKQNKPNDLVFLVPKPIKQPRYSKNAYLTFLAFLAISLLLLSLGGWYYNRNKIIFFHFIIDDNISEQPVCTGIPDFQKFDCYPDDGASEAKCLKRGCCYKSPSSNQASQTNLTDDFPPLNVPYCYFPSNYNGYNLGNISQDGRKITANLKRNVPSGFPKDVQNLQLTITFLDDTTIRIKIIDPNVERFEVPLPISDELKNLKTPIYKVNLNIKSGNLVISRKSSGTVIFNTSLSQMVYSNQFLQLSSNLPSPYIYGIGEHYGSFLRDVNWSRITILNSDRPPVPNYPLYGTQPFYLSLEKDGNANGVFLFNSNPMDVILQPTPAVTFRPIGGILDFFVLLGPSPANVVQQFTSIVGRTFMPPYWSLGFHLCRFGYNTLNNTQVTMQRNIDAGIPLDVQWNDIDYMDRYKDFTYDEKNFKGLPEFVKDIQNKGMHYILMTDPGLSSSEKPGTYPPFDDGVVQDVFIKNPNGTIFMGKVWTDGQTAFPDFSHPNATSFWEKHFTELYKKVQFDGVWIDMNEPSNFYDGGIDGCMSSPYEDPPYLPNGNLPLRHKTVCMTAKHFKTIHYNEHNIYGYREAAATNQALRNIRGKRPFIISRASFSGQGQHSGHWSGDVSSSWEDMRYTIPSMLNFNLYGMSMIGSDICGFNGNTTVELCARWQALGAFYPFSRNHNERVTMEQDPVALGPVVVEATRTSLYIRYYLLPYLYTLFYRSHIYGETVIRPLFFEYPLDKNTYNIDQQFLWGPAFMVIPVLYANTSIVTAYLPKGTWYNNSGYPIKSNGGRFQFPGDISRVNVALREGHIIPAQVWAQTTTESRKRPFVLIATVDENKESVGELYWDDGDSLETYEQGKYNLIEFAVKNNTFKTYIAKSGFEDPMVLAGINVVGIDPVAQVTADGVQCIKQNTNSEAKMNLSDHKYFETPVNAACFYAYNAPSTLSVGVNSKTLLSPITISWD